MDKAKSAVKDFTSKAGHKDTTVHESVAPAVQHEEVKPAQHETVKKAVDKEIHQDHYHRTVQPVQDREVLPESHTAKVGDVQHREYDHRDHEGTHRALAAEQGQYRDERVIHDTRQTKSTAPAVEGEHVHHHLHETIQPIVNKETIAPNVVHTTVPIHETHHNAAQHHTASNLPPMSMDEYKDKGGVLGGREERYDAFEGEPKNVGGPLRGHKKRDSHQMSTNMPGMDAPPPGVHHGDIVGKDAQGRMTGDIHPGGKTSSNPSSDAHVNAGANKGGSIGAAGGGAAGPAADKMGRGGNYPGDAGLMRETGAGGMGQNVPAGDSPGNHSKDQDKGPSFLERMNPLSSK